MAFGIGSSRPTGLRRGIDENSNPVMRGSFTNPAPYELILRQTCGTSLHTPSRPRVQGGPRARVSERPVARATDDAHPGRADPVRRARQPRPAGSISRAIARAVAGGGADADVPDRPRNPPGH